MPHEVTSEDTQRFPEVAACDFIRVTKTRSGKNKPFTRHFKMISCIITIRTPVVVLFLWGLCLPGLQADNMFTALQSIRRELLPPVSVLLFPARPVSAPTPSLTQPRAGGYAPPRLKEKHSLTATSGELQL